MAPVIPDTVIDMDRCFLECKSLKQFLISLDMLLIC